LVINLWRAAPAGCLENEWEMLFMADQDILQRVIKVTARVLNLDPSTIQPTSNFVFDLGAESVQSVELVSSFEEEFGIEMDEDAALSVQTVQGAAEFIGKYLK
jgi:acyl carrier protein